MQEPRVGRWDVSCFFSSSNRVYVRVCVFVTGGGGLLLFRQSITFPKPTPLTTERCHAEQSIGSNARLRKEKTNTSQHGCQLNCPSVLQFPGFPFLFVVGVGA